MRELTELLKKEIDLLPSSPGVYLMKEEDERIIYIGKAKNLKKRVSQYFLREQYGKVAAMVLHVHHFETILVNTEKEAFILEMNLIKKHRPRYNIMLMDDSHYPYIALRRKDAYLKVARKAENKRDYLYFGPFPDSSSCYRTIRLINSLYPTRKCKNLPTSPCLYYHMGQCLAPCFKEIDEGTYENLYSSIKSFLEGNASEVKKNLKEKMDKAIEEMRYEDAKEYRDTLLSLEKTLDKQVMESGDKTSRDVFGYAIRDGYMSLSVLTYREGKLLGKQVSTVPLFGEENEAIIDLIETYYADRVPPSEIAIRLDGIEERFADIFPETTIVYPKEGRVYEQLQLSAYNASSALNDHFLSSGLSDDKLALLEELGSLLNIKTPYRIELFDNSHLQGDAPVGAMVCYINGEKSKNNYRKFLLTEEEAGDDYHSMVGVTYRRYKRLREEGSSYPDLILADGGLTQVHAVKEGLAKAEVSIPVYGLYKNSRHETEGLIDEFGKTYPLDKKSPLFFLLMRMQDEVHRFAITFHRQKRGKKMGATIFDEVPGIGEKRKEALRKRYPSPSALSSATVAELEQLLPKEVAISLFNKLHPSN